MIEFNSRYILDNDQPTTCPKCGARTDFEQFEEDGTIVQKHRCLNINCAFVFLGEFESEAEYKSCG